jgi:hypothetical protein
MSYTFHPAAESEFLESVGYYESKVNGLGQALISEFSVLMNLIIDNPEAWQVEANNVLKEEKKCTMILKMSSKELIPLD